MFLCSFSGLAAWICGLFLVFATLMTSLGECLLLKTHINNFQCDRIENIIFLFFQINSKSSIVRIQSYAFNLFVLVVVDQ